MIELCILRNSKIANAFFKHKPIQLTTWQSSAPYLNQINSKTNTQKKKPVAKSNRLHTSKK